jgi:four helix bundle protein
MTEYRKGSYEDLIVWQKSITFVKETYRLTQGLPLEEKFGLISQMRRAAVSIPSNIAEGHARHTTSEYIRFISIAEGSLAELKTQLIISIELEFCKKEEVENLLKLGEEIRKMLNALRRSLANK